jgi:peptide/nickel transport system permease protein
MTARMEFWARFSRNRLAVGGLVILVLVVAMALLAPVLFPGDPLKLVTRPRLWPFDDARFPLGSDRLGRDMMALMFHGARVSLLIGVVASATATLVGCTIGAAAGYFGGWVDDVLMRVTEIFQTIPHFLFALVLVAVLGPARSSVIVAIAVVTWPSIARLVRAETLSLREREFVLSCRAAGMSDLRIIATQILPNALPPIIVLSSVIIAVAILVESALSFLGLGDPNVPSWGTVIGDGREVLRTSWYISLIPGIAILLAVLAINLVGEGLNDALNPRLKER